MRLTLREVRDEDLPLLFEQWADPVAVHMAAFTAPDHMEWDAFERRWSRLRADDTLLNRAIVVDDDVAGTIGSWGDPGEREVTYWIGRPYWGKGIATGGLGAFLAVDRARPLQRWAGVVLSALLGAGAVALVLASPGLQALGAAGTPVEPMTLERVGTVLFRDHLLAVEAVGLLLLAAMVGAVALVKKEL